MTTNSELLKKIDPQHFFDQFISEDVYPDGRETVQFRPLCIEQCVDARSCGSSYVQQGGAYVSCTVNLSVAPDSDEPPILYEINALDCVNKAFVDEADAHLARIVRCDHLINVDDLKIGNGMQNTFDLRFTLHLKIVVMSADGFLFDAVLTAVQASILSTRLPKVEYSGMAILESDSLEIDDIPLHFDITKLKLDWSVKSKFLTLKDFIVHASFLLYFNLKKEYKLLCDPPNELLSLITNRCDITIGKNERIYSLTFNSGCTVKDSILSEIFRIAKRRHTTISNAVDRCQKQLQQQQKC